MMTSPCVKADSVVVLNEIMYHPLGPEPEWIELYNQMAIDIDLSGWSLCDAVDYTFPTGTILQAGAFLIVAESPVGLADRVPNHVQILGPMTGKLSNNGETIRLRNHAGRLMNEVAYQGGGDWPAAANGTGVSLAKIDPMQSSDDPAHWSTSDQVSGTPGLPNTVSLPVPPVMTENGPIVINEIMYHIPTLPAQPTQSDTVTLVPEVTPARTLVPQDDSLRLLWTGAHEPFDVLRWRSGNGQVTGIGYESSTGYESYIGTDLGFEMPNQTTSAYCRITFEVQIPDQFKTLRLLMRYDDGFVAYLNGLEVARANAPANPTWDSRATGSRSDSLAVVFDLFDITPALSVLKSGTNVLAIHGLNISATSSDFLIQPKLEAVKQEPTPDQTDGPAASGTWIELLNVSDQAVDLSHWRFTRGVTFTFDPGTVLAPQAFLVVAKDANALIAEFPDIDVVGNFTGSLSRSGETLQLTDAMGHIRDAVRYYDGPPWPVYADGGGCSLELKDPFADNNMAAAWGASEESRRSAWQQVVYRDTAQTSAVGNDSLYHEFVLGLLDSGEILIDDIQVIEDPGRTAISLLQNGDFSLGTHAWRIIGNHRHSRIEADPDDPSNPVLRVMATGPTEHMSNHAETTLADRRSIANGKDYEIRFRARWMAGSPLVHTRLFFNRLARTTVLTLPDQIGTPGRQNSCFDPTLGPTCDALIHSPAVPDLTQNVTVTVRAHDPDGINHLQLRYREDNGPWHSAAMTDQGSHYAGLIQVASLESSSILDRRHAQAKPGVLVQFYVEAVDTLGHISWTPAAGPEAYAQFQYQDGQSPGTALHTYRVVMREADRDFLYEPTHLMSNERLGATLIYNEQDIFYNIGIRLKSSEHGRPKTARVGYNIRFNADHLFRGVHDTIAFDRSDGQNFGQREMLSHMAMNRFGDVSKYSDLGYMIAPLASHTGGVEVQMARYGDVFLEETYGKDGGQGTLFEYELVYPLTQTVGNDPEGLKIPQEGGGVQGRAVSDYLGPDKEQYRWHFLIKNNRDQDDYNGIILMTQVLGLTGTAFEQAARDTLDVDQWLKSFAVSATLGISDNWINNSKHNAMFYVRSSDRKVLFLPHDMDFLYSVSRSVTSNSTLRKMIAVPQWRRRFYGYVAEYLQTSFNAAYLSHWTGQFSELLPQQDWSGRLNYVNLRHQNVLNQVRNAVGSEVPFSIDRIEPAATDNGTLLVTGTGWVNVFNIHMAGVRTNLEIQWLDVTTWRTQLANRPGPVTLEALNSQGEVVGTDSF